MRLFAEGEEEEEEEELDVDAEPSEIQIAPTDIPQAFTHYTYRQSRHRIMVCDLQGVLDTTSTPPLFELTDPVIHYKSDHGKSHVYGRTDRGTKGMQDFLRTHTCNDLCRELFRQDVRWRRNRRSRKKERTNERKRCT